MLNKCTMKLQLAAFSAPVHHPCRCRVVGLGALPRTASMWLIRYATCVMALGAVLGGMPPAPVSAAKTSVWQLRRQMASVEDPEVGAYSFQFGFESGICPPNITNCCVHRSDQGQGATVHFLQVAQQFSCAAATTTRVVSRCQPACIQHHCRQDTPGHSCLFIVQAIIEKCRKQSAAGKGRCSELV